MVSAMKFQTTGAQFPVPCGAKLHLAVTLERNEFRGVVSPSLIIKDIHFAETDQEEFIRECARVAALRRGEAVENAAECLPERAHTTALYRLLYASGQWVGNAEQLWYAVGRGMRLSQLLVALESLREAALVQVNDAGDMLSIATLPTEGKADLNKTPIMEFLHTLV